MDKQNPRVGAAGLEDPRTQEIRAEIEDTREQMSETVNEIQERLRPAHLADQARESMKQAVNERAREVADSRPVRRVRSHPIPAAMVGLGAIGLAWLAFSGDDEEDDYGRRRYRGTSYGGRDLYRTMDEDDLEPRVASTTMYETSPRATSISSRMSSPRGSQFTRTINDNPLLIGAAAAIGGALVGLAVRETESENRLMGSTRDSIVEGAKQTVREKVETVKDAVGDAVGATDNKA